MDELTEMDQLAEKMTDELGRHPTDEEVWTRHQEMCQNLYWRSLESMISERLGK